MLCPALSGNTEGVQKVSVIQLSALTETGRRGCTSVYHLSPDLSPDLSSDPSRGTSPGRSAQREVEASCLGLTA